MRRVVLEAQEQVVQLLRENRDRLDHLAQALLEHETLDEDDAYAAAGVAHRGGAAGRGVGAGGAFDDVVRRRRSASHSCRQSVGDPS